MRRAEEFPGPSGVRKMSPGHAIVTRCDPLARSERRPSRCSPILSPAICKPPALAHIYIPALSPLRILIPP